MIIDTHAHLFYDNIIAVLDEILERASNIGITKIIIPAVDLKSSEKILKLTEKYDMLYGAVGFHPCDIKENNISEIKELEQFTGNKKIVAIGEIGLDYYWDKTYTKKQIAFFTEQIEFAKDVNLPVIIHTRDSIDDAIDIVKTKQSDKLKGQFHCFSGTIKQLYEIIDINNIYISYCGNITFKKYTDIEIIKETPFDRLLAETDSPYLTPEPFRGKQNEPSRIIYTLEKIASIKEIEKEELLEMIYSNTLNLFFK